MRRITLTLLALALTLSVLVAPLGVQAGTHPQAPTRAIGPDSGAPVVGPFVPQQPLGRGLSLLPGTARHDYGNLTPLHVDATHALTPLARLDLSRYDMPVGDQSYVGSCTAWATIYSLGGWWARKEGLPVTAFAPMYAYHQINNGVDRGSFVADALGAGQSGILPMGAYAPGNYDWKTAPTGAAMARAGRIHFTDPLTTYQKPMGGDDYGGQGPQAPPTRSDQMNALRYQLEVGMQHVGPQVLSLAVMTNFDKATPQTAYIYDDTAGADLVGYHAVLAVKYDAAGVWVENQWSTAWGLNGYAELSWDYVLDNVSEADGVRGLVEAPGMRVTPTTGIPTLSTQVVTDGIPLATDALAMGHEVVLRGRGFAPGEIVSLLVDGRYRLYMTAMDDGTVSTELYDHNYGETAHNVKWRPGLHRIELRGAAGDYAWTTLLTA